MSEVSDDIETVRFLPSLINLHQLLCIYFQVGPLLTQLVQLSTELSLMEAEKRDCSRVSQLLSLADSNLSDVMSDNQKAGLLLWTRDIMHSTLLA